MNTLLQVRVSRQRKEEARRVLEKVGLNLSSGVNLFLEHIVVNKGVPFVSATSAGLKLKRWKQYQRDLAWTRKHGKRYSSVDELMRDLVQGQ